MRCVGIEMTDDSEKQTSDSATAARSRVESEAEELGYVSTCELCEFGEATYMCRQCCRDVCYHCTELDVFMETVCAWCV